MQLQGRFSWSIHTDACSDWALAPTTARRPLQHLSLAANLGQIHQPKTPAQSCKSGTASLYFTCHAQYCRSAGVLSSLFAATHRLGLSASRLSCHALGCTSRTHKPWNNERKVAKLHELRTDQHCWSKLLSLVRRSFQVLEPAWFQILKGYCLEYPQHVVFTLAIYASWNSLVSSLQHLACGILHLRRTAAGIQTPLQRTIWTLENRMHL